MVWKRLIIFGCTLAVILALPLTASAAEVYNDGNISTTILTYFQDMMSKVSLTDDYVLFRSGQYEYTMYVGDISHENYTFTSSDILDVYIITTNTGSSYSSAYTFYSSTISGCHLINPAVIVYSNLGDYPDLNERGDYLETASLLLILVIVCMSLVARIFSFSMRSRNRW